MPTPRSLTAALVVLVPTLFACPTTWAQSGNSNSTLDLTLHTGVKTPPPSRKGSLRGGRTATLSRSASRARRSTRDSAVLGKLAVVSAESATIRRGRDNYSQVLSTVSQNTNLAIVSEDANYYSVLMSDNTTGWVLRSQVRLLDFQVAVRDPNAPAPAPQPLNDIPMGVPQGLDSQTEALLREAFTYLGVPYVWAGNTRSGIDCSGFVKQVFATQGIRLPRHSGDQAKVGQPVVWEDLRAGDRLYFAMGGGKRISHTGIYLGNGYFIHASSNQRKVGVDSILKPNYYKALVNVRR